MSTHQNQNQILNAKMEVVKEFKTENGGLVIVYLVTSQTILEEFYVASYDNGYNEVAWGMGFTIEDAIRNASQRWEQKKDELDEDNYNPFEEVLKIIHK